MYNCTTPSKLMASLHGRNMDALLQSISVIVNIVSYSPKDGNFVKSIAIVSKGLALLPYQGYLLMNPNPQCRLLCAAHRNICLAIL